MATEKTLNFSLERCEKKNKKLTKEEYQKRLLKKGITDIRLEGNYINTKTKTLFKCLHENCKMTWEATPNNILKGNGCPYCAGKKVIKGRNSLGDIKPDLVKYFVSPEVAFAIPKSTHKKYLLKCPYCGREKEKRIDDLFFQGFSCDCCSSSISYPNRLIRNILDQFQSEIDKLEYEWSPNWANRQRYDVYFEKNNNKYVIEVQGLQHYKRGWRDKRSLEEIQEKDLFKNNQAQAHGITPIIIDARKPTFSFIYENIKKSLLAELFSLEKLDKSFCQQKTSNNLVYEICKAYSENPEMSLSELSEEFHLCKNTIAKYLKEGTIAGWCHYLSKSQRKVKAFNPEGKEIGIFSSLKECQREIEKRYNVKVSNITRAIQRKGKNKGFSFEYYEEVVNNGN